VAKEMEQVVEQLGRLLVRSLAPASKVLRCP